MATPFFDKFNPSRTQSNQRPKINIRNQRENTAPHYKLFCSSYTERNAIGQKRSLTQWKPEHYSCIRIYTIAISVQCQL